MKFSKEKENRCSSRGRGIHLIYIIDIKNSDDDMSVDPTVDILTIEILKEKSYTWPALRSS